MHPLNKFVWCRIAPSPIHGVGVFAIRDIPDGTPLTSGNRLYSKKDEDTILPEILNLMQDHWLDLEFRTTLPNPNHDVRLQCFMNHSDTPNSDGKFALRDIKKGEEVTEDFREVVNLGEKALKYFTFI